MHGYVTWKIVKSDTDCFLSLLMCNRVILLPRVALEERYSYGTLRLHLLHSLNLVMQLKMTVPMESVDQEVPYQLRVFDLLTQATTFLCILLNHKHMFLLLLKATRSQSMH